MHAGIAVLLLIGSVGLGGGGSDGAPRFDGAWTTTITCPAEGKTEGFSLQVPSVVKDSNFRGELGTPGEPGYLLIEGRIADDGAARLVATNVGGYSYTIRAQFQEQQGTGSREEGRTCKVEFLKISMTSQNWAW